MVLFSCVLDQTAGFCVSMIMHSSVRRTRLLNASCT